MVRDLGALYKNALQIICVILTTDIIKGRQLFQKDRRN